MSNSIKKCIHFTGVMNKQCNAGVTYSEVRAGPMMFPCLQTGGECSKAQFPTPEEAEREEREMMQHTASVLTMCALAKDHYTKTGKRSDTIQCSCGGQITYAVAHNEHMRASCPNCGSFME